MKKVIKLLVLLLLLCLVVAGGFLLVREDSSTFYASILYINGENLLVNGLSVNDINFRGQFYFVVTEKTKIEWHNTAIALDDLQAGQNIAITFRGAIRESEPAGISNISKIQLLEDSLEP